MSAPAASVLLIENDSEDADLIRQRLSEATSTFKVNCVARLADGFEQMRNEPPSVVLLNLDLSDSQGAKTFRALREQAPEIPIVVLSAENDPGLAIAAVQQGVQDVLVKSGLSSSSLERSICYAVERQALLRALEGSRRQQLAFKNRFLSHVSHELRTPLTCIHQYVTLLLDGLAGDMSLEQRDHLSTVLRSVNQLHAMIRDLLEATRIETGKVQLELCCVSIADLIRQSVAMMGPTAREKGIGLEIGLDSRVPLLYADPDRVLEILVNLIDNGIKFTPREGSVLVKACMSDSDLKMVYVSVSDTGRGVSAEAKPLIFDRLYQDPNRVDNHRSGLGLGLYISRELVQMQGGRIWVESEAGTGSTFTFTLPLYSLAHLLTPILIHDGCLRHDVMLVQVELISQSRSLRGGWAGVCCQCFEVLTRCVYLDKDVVLPRTGRGGSEETFFIVASTDLAGANVMMTRICEQMETRTELKRYGGLNVLATPVELPENSGKSNDLLVNQIADRVSEMVIAALERNREKQQ